MYIVSIVMIFFYFIKCKHHVMKRVQLHLLIDASFRQSPCIITDKLRLRERSHQQLLARKMDRVCILVCKLLPSELKARSNNTCYTGYLVYTNQSKST